VTDIGYCYLCRYTHSDYRSCDELENRLAQRRQAAREIYTRQAADRLQAQPATDLESIQF
jgi:hypothetical protein